MGSKLNTFLFQHLEANSVLTMEIFFPHGIVSNTRLERTIQGTADWQTYDITLQIPDEPGQIEFGLMLYGPGQIWLRDTRFLTIFAP
jgi:hypothetical protein